MAATAEIKGRVEDARLASGHGRFVSDLAPEGMLHAAIVRSPYAHAGIGDIDTEDARAAPGVIGVFMAADLAADGIPDLPCGVDMPRPNGETAYQAHKPVLARDRVLWVGQPVALVVAETVAEAVDAAELVDVDYDERPAVATMAEALKPGARAVWDQVPDNIAMVWTRGDADATDKALEQAPHVVRLDSFVSRVVASTLEPRGCVGRVDADGRLVLHISHQGPHGLKPILANLFSREPKDVRVVADDVGGSFGMKSGAYPEDVMVLWAAVKTGRSVRWIADRTEAFLADDHGRDVAFQASLGLDEDGRFLALRVHFDVGIGCYLSRRALGLINNAGGIAGVYRIPHIAGRIRGIYTHTQTVAPYRGAGRPEATYATERVIDLAARRLGIDPFELRRRNLVPPEAMPYDTGFTFVYDCGEFAENMALAARLADRAGFEARRADSAERGMLRGLGVANPVECAGGPFGNPGQDHTRLRVGSDGGAMLHSGIMSTGQGLETAMTQLISQRLNIPMERIGYTQGDTDDLPGGRGSGGSSGLSVGGTAVTRAIDKVIETGRGLAAELLDAAADQVDFADGIFSVRGTNRTVDLNEVARAAEQRSGQGLEERAEFKPPDVTYPNGCHLCEVEIDPETGSTRVVRYTIAEDLGNVLNPQLVRGQLHGGVAQGVGQALGERIVHDEETGQLLSASYMDYAMPRADLLPDLTIETRSVPTEVNPLGAKGVGEAGNVGSIVAAINAVCDALSPLGIHHIEMPATPDRVWAAIQAAKG